MKASLIKRVCAAVTACVVLLSAVSCNEIKVKQTDTDQLAFPEIFTICFLGHPDPFLR